MAKEKPLVSTAEPPLNGQVQMSADTCGEPRLSASDAMRREFRAGVRSMAPFMVSAIPLAMVGGALGVTSGLGYFKTLLLAMVVNSGTVQFVGINLIHEHVGWVAVLVTTLILSLRLVLYSTVLSQATKMLPQRWRFLLGFGLIDALFFVVSDRLNSETEHSGSWRWFYVGGSAAMYCTWMVSTAAGMAAGAPLTRFAGTGLDFPMTAIFAAMLASTLGNWKIGCAVLSAGALALAGSSLPYNTGLILAVLAGAATGGICEWLEKAHRRNAEAV